MGQHHGLHHRLSGLSGIWENGARGRRFFLATGQSCIGFNASHAFLSKRYWFSVPYRGILLSTMLYAAGLVAGWT